MFLQQLATEGFDGEALGDFYDEFYTTRDVSRWRWLGAKDKADNIVRMLGARADQLESILEVGAGDGAVLLRLQERYPAKSLTGFEIVKSEVEEFASKHAESGIKILHYDGSRIPLPDACVDLVFASHVLEHVPDERGFLRELKRVARRFVYVEVPCELHLRTNIATLSKTLQIGHINAYTPESFMLTLVTSGLRVLDLDLFEHSVEVHAFSTTRARALLKHRLRSTLLSLNKRLASRLFSYHCGALCN